MTRVLEVIDFALKDYEQTLTFQKERVESRMKETGLSDCLIFVEHPNVYTYGRKFRDSIPTEGVEVSRGGEATFHNPGQLVIYPILRLEERERDLHAYLRQLEEVLIRVLSDFGISSERRPNATGVWVGERSRKIASLGVAVKSWVTYHGSALNVSNDLSGFSHIEPCGFSSEVMTSIERELGTAPSMSDVKRSYLQNFAREFGRSWIG